MMLGVVYPLLLVKSEENYAKPAADSRPLMSSLSYTVNIDASPLQTSRHRPGYTFIVA